MAWGGSVRNGSVISGPLHRVSYQGSSSLQRRSSCKTLVVMTGFLGTNVSFFTQTQLPQQDHGHFVAIASAECHDIGRLALHSTFRPLDGC